MGFLLFIVLALRFSDVSPRVCEVGYGQRGFKRSDAIVWRRNCKKSDYCFEAVTTDIRKMRPIIDYPWVRALFSKLIRASLSLLTRTSSFVSVHQGEYYREYFVKGCGGDLGMENMLNISAPVPKTVDLVIDRTITTEGGTVEFNLKYRCMKDLCSGTTHFGFTPLPSNDVKILNSLLSLMMRVTLPMLQVPTFLLAAAHTLQL